MVGLLVLLLVVVEVCQGRASTFYTAVRMMRWLRSSDVLPLQVSNTPPPQPSTFRPYLSNKPEPAFQEARSLGWVSAASPMLPLVRAWDYFNLANVHWGALVRVSRRGFGDARGGRREGRDSVSRFSGVCGGVLMTCIAVVV